jgi:predicted Rossmann-fold nucleotide-binding protein
VGFHQKPAGLLNLQGFYDPLLAQVERARQCGLVRETHGRPLLTATTPAALLAVLLTPSMRGQ